MANLPEKNITLVDKITSIPSNSNLFLNADGEFRQASVNDVIKSATVVSDTVNNAINDAMQDSIDSHFKQATGSPILLTDTADGTLIDFKGKGRSTQTQYSGKNLANVKDKTSGTTEGITSSIANEVVTASGTSTGNGDIFISLSTNIVMESGTDYTISIQEITGTMPSYFTVYLRDDSTSIFSNYDTMSTSNLSVVFNITDTIECSGVLFRISTNNTINGTFRLQIEKGTTKTDYEPYVGGTASPNPDYPQAIKSVADSGWFDGELLGGYYDGSGVFVYGSNTTNVGSKKPIPCKGGDVIKIIYEESISAITVALYDENMMFIDRPYKLNTNEFVITAPSNAKYMNFHLSAEYIITPTTAKHITVTINGKYALIVKSEGKNILDYSRIKTTSANGATLTNNNDGSFTISGSGILSNAFNTYFDYSHEETVRLLKVGELKLDINGVATTPYLYIQLRSGTNAYLQISSSDDVKTKNVTQAMLDDENVYLRIGFYGASTGVSIVAGTMKPMLYQYGDSDFVAHKTHTSYIPLSAPLRGVGEVKDEVSLTEVTRRFAEVVFDGTEDWHFADNSNINYTYTSSISNAKPNSLVVCNAMCSTDLRLEENNCYINANKIPIFCSDSITSVDEFKARLQSNPITVQYELAEPVVEAIEPVDITTYNNVTYLTASDNAEMELEYPTSKVAGIASIGYSKGRKAEYEVELLKAQLLELQTAMVNSL